MARRNWCFTLNNPTEKLKPNDDMLYLVYQLEEGEKNKTPHYQGYIEFKKPVRLSKVKKIEGFYRANLQPKYGTRDHARNYCMKEDTRIDGPWEFGKWRIQGKRTDLIATRTNIKPFQSILKIDDNELQAHARYDRFCTKIKNEKEKEATKEFRNVIVTVYWGKPGTGKSRSVLYDNNGKRKDDIYKIECNEEGKLWWDGYNGEKTILLDDFYGNLKYSYLLNLLDGHQMRLPIKGGFTYANWTNVYITSNKKPSKWYTIKKQKALERRINHIIHKE